MKHIRKIVYSCLTCGLDREQLKSTGRTKSGNLRSPRFVCETGHKVQKFDSEGEYSHYKKLLRDEQCRYISNLELQPSFDLIVNNVKVGTWTGDFSYFQHDQRVVTDFKGYMPPTDPNTQLWKLKTAIVEAVYGVKVKVARK